MRRRSRAGSIVKPRRRKPAAPKRASGSEAARRRSLSARQSGPDIARLDLTEALERETAASEILNVISSAQAASVQPILDTVVTNAGPRTQCDYLSLRRRFRSHPCPIRALRIKPRWHSATNQSLLGYRCCVTRRADHPSSRSIVNG